MGVELRAGLVVHALGVEVRRGPRTILAGIRLSVAPSTRIGVVGRNGAGKSTLLALLAGRVPVAAGSLSIDQDTSVGILLQEPPLDETKDVRGNVDEAVADVKALVDRYNAIGEEMAVEYTEELGNEMGALQDKIDHAGGWDIDSRIDMAMDALRLPPGDADVTILSGGERRRVALCKLLLEQPDLLLLDEPTNHLDAESVQWLEQHLAAYPGTVLAVTHDRYFLDNVAEWILELDRGRAYPYEGNYTTYLESKSSRLKVEGAKDAKRKKEIERELEWVRSSPRARQAKSKARLARFDELVAEADRSGPIDIDAIQIPPGPRLGSQVIKAEHLLKAFGDRVLIEDLSFSLPPGGIVGIMGPNGVGKTTLFKMIIGDEKPDDGELRIGETVQISYVDQSRAGLDPKKTLWEAVSGGTDYINVGRSEINSRAYVASFGFKGPDQQKPTGVLSGGERNRLNLALTLKAGGNLLLLDEPTNDLDVETLRSLEDALEDFPGCAVVISHDRWFLDKVATHILSWEGTDSAPGRWFWFEGGFSDYERNKIERLGEEAARPHRATYRRLGRD